MEEARREEREEETAREEENIQGERGKRMTPKTSQGAFEREEMKGDFRIKEGRSLKEGFLSQSSNSLELVSQVQETQDSKETLISPCRAGQ
jgi:hypothetical protein